MDGHKQIRLGYKGGEIPYPACHPRPPYSDAWNFRSCGTTVPWSPRRVRGDPMLSLMCPACMPRKSRAQMPVHHLLHCSERMRALLYPATLMEGQEEEKAPNCPGLIPHDLRRRLAAAVTCAHRGKSWIRLKGSAGLRADSTLKKQGSTWLHARSHNILRKIRCCGTHAPLTDMAHSCARAASLSTPTATDRAPL